MSDELVTVFVEIHAVTDLAVLVSDDDGKTKVWLPKSQIDTVDFEIGDVLYLEIPEWLAETNGLV